MPYPPYPTGTPPCGPASWPVPAPLASPGLFLQDGTGGTFNMCKGAANDFQGDFVATGCGTRNAGQGNLKLLLPKGFKGNEVEITGAWLIINTYVSDIVNDPTGPEPYTFTHESGATQSLTGGYKYWCGSTCWLNPAPDPVTTYLRNRIYIYDVGTYVIAQRTGNYTVGGLPLTTPLMPISTDGDRLPGCASSQGAVLFVIYNASKGNARFIQTYVGARLIASGGPWGGVASQLLTFNQTTPGPNNFSGNAKATMAAGDTQSVIGGDSANVNNILFQPATNSFRKIGSSLSIITQRMSNIYAGNNQATAETLNDCVSWFLYAISADDTQPRANFKPVVCVSNTLQLAMNAGQTDILVNGNNSLNPFPPGCSNVANNKFPPAPFYVKIDNEILLVNKVENAPAPPDAPAIVPPNQEPRHWFVARGAGGTTPAAHAVNSCVKMVMPIEGKAVMQAALARRGQPVMRPGAGFVNNGNKIQGF